MDRTSISSTGSDNTVTLRGHRESMASHTVPEALRRFSYSFPLPPGSPSIVDVDIDAFDDEIIPELSLVTDDPHAQGIDALLQAVDEGMRYELPPPSACSSLSRAGLQMLDSAVDIRSLQYSPQTIPPSAQYPHYSYSNVDKGLADLDILHQQAPESTSPAHRLPTRRPRANTAQQMGVYGLSPVEGLNGRPLYGKSRTPSTRPLLTPKGTEFELESTSHSSSHASLRSQSAAYSSADITPLMIRPGRRKPIPIQTMPTYSLTPSSSRNAGLGLHVSARIPQHAAQVGIYRPIGSAPPPPAYPPPSPPSCSLPPNLAPTPTCTPPLTPPPTRNPPSPVSSTPIYEAFTSSRVKTPYARGSSPLLADASLKLEPFKLEPTEGPTSSTSQSSKSSLNGSGPASTLSLRKTHSSAASSMLAQEFKPEDIDTAPALAKPRTVRREAREEKAFPHHGLRHHYERGRTTEWGASPCSNYVGERLKLSSPSLSVTTPSVEWTVTHDDSDPITGSQARPWSLRRFSSRGSKRSTQRVGPRSSLLVETGRAVRPQLLPICRSSELAPLSEFLRNTGPRPTAPSIRSRKAKKSVFKRPRQGRVENSTTRGLRDSTLLIAATAAVAASSAASSMTGSGVTTRRQSLALARNLGRGIGDARKACGVQTMVGGRAAQRYVLPAPARLSIEESCGAKPIEGEVLSSRFSMSSFDGLPRQEQKAARKKAAAAIEAMPRYKPTAPILPQEPKGKRWGMMESFPFTGSQKKSSRPSPSTQEAVDKAHRSAEKPLEWTVTADPSPSTQLVTHSTRIQGEERVAGEDLGASATEIAREAVRDNVASVVEGKLVRKSGRVNGSKKASKFGRKVRGECGRLWEDLVYNGCRVREVNRDPSWMGREYR